MNVTFAHRKIGDMLHSFFLIKRNNPCGLWNCPIDACDLGDWVRQRPMLLTLSVLHWSFSVFRHMFLNVHFSPCVFFFMCFALFPFMTGFQSLLYWIYYMKSKC